MRLFALTIVDLDSTALLRCSRVRVRAAGHCRDRNRKRVCRPGRRHSCRCWCRRRAGDCSPLRDWRHGRAADIEAIRRLAFERVRRSLPLRQERIAALAPITRLPLTAWFGTKRFEDFVAMRNEDIPRPLLELPLLFGSAKLCSAEPGQNRGTFKKNEGFDPGADRDDFPFRFGPCFRRILCRARVINPSPFNRCA